MNRNGLRYGGCELQKKIPLRMCVGCREMRPKRELVRVVCSKDGQISVDLTGKAAGRGAYVCPTEECLKKAVKTRALERAFSQKSNPKSLTGLRRRLSTQNRTAKFCGRKARSGARFAELIREQQRGVSCFDNNQRKTQQFNRFGDESGQNCFRRFFG